jgi:ribosomal-protein-alanine N-acetyltransferase
VIGLFTINKWNARHRHAEIGYDLARPYWGYGIASEALSAMLQFCFEDMAFNHVEADTLVVNTRSVRLLERLGFQREGTRREYILEDDGLFYDSAIYSLLRREYYGS